MDSSNSLKVPYTFDGIKVGDIHEIKIKNIYDPSKLWIIVNFRELILFTKYLKIFYSNDENRIKVPIFKLRKYLLCIIERNSCYYRAITLPILLPDEDKIRVFLIDQGSFINVNVTNIFYILQKHSEVPRFALRACLINIAPSDVKDSLVWTTGEQKFLTELIADKTLYAKIEEINKDNNILFIDIFIKEKSESINMVESVSLKMLEANMASPGAAEPKKLKRKTKYVPTVMYPHLYPTIEAIEEGKVPSSLWEQNLVKDVPLDLLLSPYYKYQDINSYL